MDYDKLKPIPKVGEFYHFFDDGKTSPSRHYICKCERILTNKEAKKETVSVNSWDFDRKENFFVDKTLYDFWKDEAVPNHDWLFDTETDYFVECSCPKYDENNLWFVRTKDGGWFSMDIQSSWQGGRLDVDGSIYEAIKEDYKKWNECSDDEVLIAYPEATEENWRK